MKQEIIQPYIEKGLVTERAHPEFQELSIYNYTNKCQIDGAWDEVTLQCRGLVINTKTGEIIAKPFPKFFNLEERKSEIPSEQPYIFEKYDGSLGILYWIGDLPYIATRGSFESDQAIWATKWFRENIKDYSLYDRNSTYLFEIIYPENRIVVQYNFSGLVLLAVRNTETGIEQFESKDFSPILKCKQYEPMALDKLKELETENAEGFVVFYPESGLRIKLKFEEYKRLHRIVTCVTSRSIWDALRSGSDLTEILERVPDEFYKWVKELKTKLESKYKSIEETSLVAKNTVIKMESRKEQAIWLKANIPQYMGIIFAMLDGKDYSQLIWNLLKPSE
jgi:RNA ligase